MSPLPRMSFEGLAELSDFTINGLVVRQAVTVAEAHDGASTF